MLSNQFRFRSKNNEVTTKKVNKIALNYIDNKKIKTNDGKKHTYSRRRNGYRIKIINFYDVAKKKKNTMEHDAN